MVTVIWGLVFIIYCKIQNDFSVCCGIIVIFVSNKISGYDARGTYSEDTRHRMG